jgi:pilus assembly protein CpaB
MRRNRLILGISAAVILGLLASSLVYREMSRLAAIKPIPVIQIVVAAGPLPLGSPITEEKIRLLPWPGNAPLPGMFTRISDCLGRAVMTDMVENEPILESKLAPLQAGAGLAVTIPAGLRALSVPVNEVVGVAGFVVPGTVVDVLLTGNLPNGARITKTILERVRVLAAGQTMQRDRDGKPQSSTVVTLLVTPQEADKLSMAAVQGRIQLALRNTVDPQKLDPPAVFEASLYGFQLPAPVAKPSHRPPTPPVVVEVIYGSKRDFRVFPNP